MLAEITLSIAHNAPIYLASEDGDSSGISLILLAAGFVFYIAIYLKYRNTNKRHSHEAETVAKIENVVASDNKIKRVTGVSNSSIRGANNNVVRYK